MSLNSSTRNRLWQLSMNLAVFLVSVFAVVAVVSMYRTHKMAREARLRAVNEAHLEVQKLNQDLLEAVRAKDSETVGKLLNAGANPNPSDVQPRPLEIAIRNADIKSVKQLVAAGAWWAGHAHESPFVFVLDAPIEQSPKVIIFRELLEHGTDIERNQHAMDVCYGSKVPEIIAMLRQRGAPYGPREMALAGDIEGLRAALAADPDLLSRPLASYCMSSKTLLGVALRHGHEELANWMIDEGAPLEVHEISDGTALHIAAVGDCAGVIPRLCQMGCAPNAGDNSGLTPLDYCVSKASLATVQALINCGADASRVTPGLGSTSLHRAVLRYDSADESNPSNGPTLEIIALLLDGGADPDVADAQGQTARDVARTRSPAVLEVFEGH